MSDVCFSMEIIVRVDFATYLSLTNGINDGAKKPEQIPKLFEVQSVLKYLEILYKKANHSTSVSDIQMFVHGK